MSSIIDMNQSLIDDSLVEKDKFFGTNYFWSFPAKKDRQMEIQHEETLKSIELLQTQIAEAQVKCMDAKRGREDDGDERAQKLTRLTELAHERKKAEDELESLKENDPQALADLEQELKLVTQAANRWTDNIFNCKTFLTKKRGLDNKEACRILGITSDFDCEYIIVLVSMVLYRLGY
jgi:hypothetical protein